MFTDSMGSFWNTTVTPLVLDMTRMASPESRKSEIVKSNGKTRDEAAARKVGATKDGTDLEKICSGLA